MWKDLTGVLEVPAGAALSDPSPAATCRLARVQILPSLSAGTLW